jgi:hypothetical protein
VSLALEPAQILGDVLRFDPALRCEPYYGERALFYNPGGRAPLGTIFCSIKDRDGPNDKASRLSRPGVYRFAFAISEATLLLVHVLPAVVGLLVLVAYAITDLAALAWLSCAILAFVAAWGVRNFLLWQQAPARRAEGDGRQLERATAGRGRSAPPAGAALRGRRRRAPRAARRHQPDAHRPHGGGPVARRRHAG